PSRFRISATAATAFMALSFEGGGRVGTPAMLPCPPSSLPSRSTEERGREKHMSDTEIIWRPTPEVIERARLTRFMRAHGVASLEALQRRSVEDPEWYWDGVSRYLGFRWMTPYRRVLDTSRGIAFPRWFEGGLMNLSDNCVDRHVDEGRGEQPAIIWEA